jgi:uncharacterized protein YbjQ (UPF0145 family)
VEIQVIRNKRRVRRVSAQREMNMPKCTNCEGNFGIIELRGGLCKQCRVLREEEQDERERKRVEALKKVGLPEGASLHVLDENAKNIFLSTSYGISSRQLSDPLGIVSSEYAVGMNIFKDIANSFRDTFGGRSDTVQKTLKDAREACFKELKREALFLGADAVVAIQISYNEVTSSGSGGGVLFVSVSGTAVKFV